MRRRHVLGTLAGAVAGGIAGCSGSASETPEAFVVSSPPLDGTQLPVRFTCAGAGRSPPFTIERVPEPTAALAVTAEYDRGLINEPVFWTLWNIPADTDQIPEHLPRTATLSSLGGARQGRQQGGEPGYEPPCPPEGQPYEHRFQVYALGETLSIEGGTDHDTATEAIGNAVLASRRFTVEFTRPTTP
jgi:Raf kinase inhibitor-like YbhB/YbcL family protein